MLLIINQIRKNRKNIDKDLKGIDKRKYFSPANYGDFKVTLPVLKQYCKGQCLDAGCGDMPYKIYIDNLINLSDENINVGMQTAQLIENNKVMRILKSLGYDIINIESGVHITNNYIILYRIFCRSILD